MVNTITYNQKENSIAEEMKKYLSILERQSKKSKTEAYASAKEALIRTGVATASGKTKKKIVSWE